MNNYPPFSEPEGPHTRKLITPLGAAVVEALPDRKAVQRIKQRFKKNGECPISAIFTAEQIVEFYREEGQAIKPVVPSEP